MCKVMIMAGIDDAHRDNAIKFTKKMAELMTPNNSDGLGYAAVDSEGKLFAQRWLKNSDAFKNTGTPPLDIKLVQLFKPYSKFKDLEVKYSEHGEVALNKMAAITLHTRAASGGVCIENVHPFIDKDTSVIHNGFIKNEDDFKLKLSSCDSESILISYLKNKVNLDMKNADDFAKSLIGYYACGTFSKDEQGNRVLDVYKANNDNLAVVFVKELNTWVISSWAVNIGTACHDLGFSYGSSLDLKDGVLMRFNPYTGESLGYNEFKVSETTVPYVRPTYTPTIVPETPPVVRGLSKEKIEFLKQKSAIRKMGYREAYEVMEDSGFYSGVS